MSAINCHKLNVAIARAFCQSISENSLYLTIGSSSSISASPTDRDTDSQAVFTSLIGAKRLKKSDAICCTPRIDWVSGKWYPSYSSSDANMYSSSSYYVLADTSAYNVYCCISGPSSSASVVKPTTTNPSINQNTGDNYTWKYLYTLSGDITNKFLTVDFLPVPYLPTAPGVSDENYPQYLVQQATSSSGAYLGADAGILLNSKYVMISGFIKFGEAQTQNGADVIPTNVTFYQDSLIFNPVDAASSKTATLVSYSSGGLVANPNTVLAINNHGAITRSANTIDNIRMVLSF